MVKMHSFEVSFEAFTVVMFQVKAFWVVTRVVLW